MLTGFEKEGFHAGQFGKTKEGQQEVLQNGRLAQKMITNFLNVSTFSVKGSIEQRVARTSARVDISDEKKLDLTTKVKIYGLTTLGARIQLESATSESESQAATGSLAQHAGRTGVVTVNTLMDRVDELWKEVITEAQEISWIDMSSKEPWWMKVWDAGERNNPPQFLQWVKKLRTKAVEARIAHYVKSVAPQTRHERFRELLPLMEAAMTAYRKERTSRPTLTGHAGDRPFSRFRHLVREAVQNVKVRVHNHVKVDLEGVYK
jgi:hypothetical protein